MKVNDTKKTDFKNKVINHMGGTSYEITNSLLQLRIIASSCFFGEPMYYHDYSVESKNKDDVLNSIKEKNKSKHNYLEQTLGSKILIPNYQYYSPSKLIETAIDEALDFDLEGTLKEAVRLRNDENIRTTPQIIMVRAANHIKSKGTGLIKKYGLDILKRTDEASVQLAYQIKVYGRPIPNSLKKVWRIFLETRNEYQLSKYRMENREFKTIDVVNLVHANSPAINKLSKGTLKIKEDQTWESFISKNQASEDNWIKAIDNMGHMALLRNINNFIKNNVSESNYVNKLVETVEKGKQLPFRYFSAFKKVNEINQASDAVNEALESCVQKSLNNLPRFKGKVVSLCDNSGSARHTMNSNYGSIEITEIANLMGVITANVSDEGYVGVFGDKLNMIPIEKNRSVFDSLSEVNTKGKEVGMSTENGIWLFFKESLENKEIYDHIFIYSDMQAGHGGLYGRNPQEYNDYIYNSRHIDVAKLVKTYREQVNPNVKVYMVQVAGYRNTLVPEFYDQAYILGGWSDQVLKFAHEMSAVDDLTKNQ